MNTKIKIFVDAHSFDKERQGTQTFVRELYTAVLEHYPNLEIYMGAYHTQRIVNAFPGMDRERILKYKHIGIRRMFSDIPSLIKRHGFQYAHFQYISPPSIKNCKYIVTLHDVVYNDMPEYFSTIYVRLRTFFFKRSFLLAAIKTTVSEHARNSISRHYGIPVSSIHVIPNAVNSFFTSRFSFGNNSAIKIKERYGLSDFILYVSRIEPRKNHVLLLKSYLRLELYKKNIPMVFIGNKSIDVPELTHLLNVLTPEQKKFIHMLNDISQNDLVAFYAACRLFVYPSKGEGFGIPPLEAAICGAPVLCSNVSAMKEFDFFEPYTFDPDAEKEFEGKFSDMISQPPGREFIEEVSKKISGIYSWQKSASKFYELVKPVY